MCKTNRSGKAAVLTSQQLERFFGQLPEKYSVLAEVMLYSAGRVKEITTLKVRNINFTDGILTIEKSTTKTKETRQVPLPTTVLANLRSWIESKGLGTDDYIFYTESRNTSFEIGSKPVSTQSVDQFFRRAFNWAGINGASTHSLRRTRLTDLHINHGWSLAAIMVISGHKDLISLQQYLDTDRKAVFAKYRDLFAKEGV